jgi:hypothetical protein
MYRRYFESGDAIEEERKKIFDSDWSNRLYLPYPFDLVVSAPAFLASNYKSVAKTLKRRFREGNVQEKEIARIIRSHIRRSSYSAVLDMGGASIKEFEELLPQLTQLFAEEMNAFCNGVAVCASNALAPVLRLPRRVRPFNFQTSLDCVRVF